MRVPIVKEIMTTKLVTLTPDMEIEDAIHIFLKHKISGASVIDKNRKLVGVLSEKDCLRIFASGAYNTAPGGLVSKYMSSNVTTVDQNAGLFTVADIFLKNAFRRLPVVNDSGVLIGQVSRSDVLKGSRDLLAEASPFKKQWTDAKYIPDQVQAVLDTKQHRS